MGVLVKESSEEADGLRCKEEEEEEEEEEGVVLLVEVVVTVAVVEIEAVGEVVGGEEREELGELEEDAPRVSVLVGVGVEVPESLPLPVVVSVGMEEGVPVSFPLPEGVGRVESDGVGGLDTEAVADGVGKEVWDPPPSNPAPGVMDVTSEG